MFRTISQQTTRCRPLLVCRKLTHSVTIMPQSGRALSPEIRWEVIEGAWLANISAARSQVLSLTGMNSHQPSTFEPHCKLLLDCSMFNIDVYFCSSKIRHGLKEHFSLLNVRTITRETLGISPANSASWLKNEKHSSHPVEGRRGQQC